MMQHPAPTTSLATPTNPRLRRGALLLALSLVALLPTAGVAHAQALPDAVTSEQQPFSATAAALAVHARAGDFDRVLRALQTAPKNIQDPRVPELIRSLSRFQTNTRKHAEQRQAEMLQQLTEMNQSREAGELEDAVIKAVDAHGLAADKEAFLARDDVKALVADTLDAAQAAEKEQNWIEAAALFRALDLLFENEVTYRDPLRRVTKHLRVLSIYAPMHLHEMSVARAKRLGEDPPTKPDLDNTWQQRLDGVELPMLRQTLAQASRRHIKDAKYNDLLTGALDKLIILLQTDGIESEFPGLNNDEKVAEFSRYLTDKRAAIARDDLNFLDAASLVHEVMEQNRQSVALPESLVVYEMTEGVTSQLDDFSAVIWPEEKNNFARNTQGNFTGVGIQISQRDGQLLVVSPLENTPAQKAGIKAGDIIARVNGQKSTTWTLDHAVREITGPEGTVVELGIERPGVKGITTYAIKRARIVIESVKGWELSPRGGWNYLIDPDLGIGYVRVTQFIPQTADDLDAAVKAMEADQKLNGLIIDLRFNPGGLLSAAIELSDRFISSGPIVSTVDAKDNRTFEARAKRHNVYRDFPVAVLINQGSASASEILSGALQDYERALIVGHRSFGKGSVQDLYPLSGGTAILKLTTQYYKLPKGRIIHRRPDDTVWGIEPDLVVEMTNQQVADAIEFRQELDVIRDGQEFQGDDVQPLPLAEQIFEKSLDPQLEAALLVLKTQLIANDLVMARGE